MLIHNVYFTLVDASDAKINELIADAKKYLKNDPGLLHFAIGRRGAEFVRPTNDQGYDICLNTVFKDKQAHDTYQVSQNHLDFGARHRANYKNLRVCDAYAD